MSEQRGGLSGEERDHILAYGGDWTEVSVEGMFVAIERIVARREAAAAAEAVEKALGPVSELADLWDRPTMVGIAPRLRSAIARGREEAGTVPQAHGNDHESDEQEDE